MMTPPELTVGTIVTITKPGEWFGLSGTISRIYYYSNSGGFNIYEIDGHGFYADELKERDDR